jgi:flavin reductase (DIM6/NTAB) family NADH-FMN oxidoreductase RutF
MRYEFGKGDLLRDYLTLTDLVAPRPVAWVSTIDLEGNHNLAPFSYFNVFSANPATLIFAVAREPGRPEKDTLANVRAVPEVVIHVATCELAYRMTMTSAPFPPETDEFVRAGLTPVPAVSVRPSRIAEAPIAFECRVVRLIDLGDGPASSTLVVCEATAVTIDDAVIAPDGKVARDAIAFVGRLGGSDYSHVSPSSRFTIQRPRDPNCRGWDGLGDAASLGSEAEQYAAAISSTYHERT